MLAALYFYREIMSIIKLNFYLLVIILFSACAATPKVKTFEDYFIKDADVYFVPIGPMSNEYLFNLASYYDKTFPLKFGITSKLQFRNDMYNKKRKQLVADELIYYMGKDFSNYSTNINAIYIGVTHVDMHLFNHKWKFAFSKRVGDTQAVVSSARMSRRAQGRPIERTEVLSGTRKMITKTIGLLHYKKPLSKIPTSVLYNRVLGLDELDKIDESTLYRDILDQKI